MNKKLSVDVKIDCYSNGVAVIITDKNQKNKIIGKRVFEGKGHKEREVAWIKKVMKKAEAKITAKEGTK